MTDHLQCEKIILGIDPGTRSTGYGLIAMDLTGYRALDYGCIKPPLNMELAERYHILFKAIAAIMQQYQPQVLAVETQFLPAEKNFQNILKLGMARGVAVVAARLHGAKVCEYPPRRVKKCIVGKGAASKNQVQMMVQLQLKLPQLPQPHDASDALALALCHAHTARE